MSRTARAQPPAIVQVHRVADWHDRGCMQSNMETGIHPYCKCNNKAEHGNGQRWLPPTAQIEVARAWALVDAVTGAATFVIASVP